MALTDGLELNVSFIQGFVLDISDNLYTITENGTPAFTTGPKGAQETAYSYDGSTDYLAINSLADDRETANDSVGSFSGWVKIDGAPSGLVRIAGYSDSSTVTGIGASIQSTGEFRFEVRDNGASSDWRLESDDPLPYNRWFHFAIVQDGSDPVLYIDGIIVDQTFTTDNDRTAWISDSSQALDRFTIGAIDLGSISQYFEDDIANIKVWSRALSHAEVLEDYNNGRPLLEQGLVFDLRYKKGYFKDGSVNNITVSPFSVFPDLSEDHNNDKDNSFEFIGLGTAALNITPLLSEISSSTTGTWTAWIYNNANDSNFSTIFAVGDADANSFMVLQKTDSSNQLRAICRNVSTTLMWSVDTTAVAPLGWFHVALVQDGSGNYPTLYIDGEAVTSVVEAGSTPDFWFNDGTNFDTFYIGGLLYNSGSTPNVQLRDGDKVADPRIYSRALSAGEIQELYDRRATPRALNYLGLRDSLSFELLGHNTEKDTSDNNISVSEVSGTFNLVTGRKGVANSAIHFNNSEYIEADGIMAEIGSQDVGSVSVWLYHTAVVAAFRHLFNSGNTDAVGWSGLRFHDASTGKINFNMRDQVVVDWSLETDDSVPIGEWYHLCIVQDGITPVIYINGIAVDQTFVTSNDTTTWWSEYAAEHDNFRIGGLNHNNAGDIGALRDTYMSELRFWDKPLSTHEIELLAADEVKMGLRSGLEFEGIFTEGLPYDAALNHTVTNTDSIVPATNEKNKSDQAATYDGTASFLNIDSVISTISANTAGTFTFWIRQDTVGTDEFLICFGDENADEFIYFYLDGNSDLNIRQRVNGTNSYFWRETSGAVVAGEWAHIALVQNGITPLIYVNGISVALTDGASGSNHGFWFNDTDSLDIGRIGCRNFNSFGNQLFYTDDIANVKIWNRALGLAEIRKDMAQGEFVGSGKGLRNGLVFELKGSSLEDVSGSKVSVTNNSTTVADGYGPFSASRGYSGTSQWLDVDDLSTALQNTTKGTVSMWLRVDDITPSSFMCAYCVGDLSTDSPLIILVETTGRLRVLTKTSGTVQWDFYIDAGTTSFSSTTEWLHVVLVHNGVEPNIYVNGELKSKTYYTTTNLEHWISGNSPNNDIVKIGRQEGSSDSGRYWDGDIADVRVWNRDLSAQEIKRVFADQFDDYYSLMDGLIVDLNLRGDDLLESVSQLTVTSTGSPTAGDGRFGDFQGAYQFNGSNQALILDNLITIYDQTVLGTISMWVEPDDATPSSPERYFCHFGDTDADSRIGIQISDGGGSESIGQVRIDYEESGTTYWAKSTNIALSDNIWYHIVLVHNGVEPIIYIDGVAVDCTDIVSTDFTRWFGDNADIDNGRIACANFNSGGNTNFFDGSISDFKMWDRALSEGEIKNLYQLERYKPLYNFIQQRRYQTLKEYDGMMVADFRMNEGSGTGAYAEPSRFLDPGDLWPNIELWYDFADVDWKSGKAQDWTNGDNINNRAYPKTTTGANDMIIDPGADSPSYTTQNGLRALDCTTNDTYYNLGAGKVLTDAIIIGVLRRGAAQIYSPIVFDGIDANDRFALGFFDTDGNAFLYARNSTDTGTIGDEPVDDTFHVFACVFDDGTDEIILRIDGTEVVTGDVTGNQQINGLRMLQNYTGGQFFKGQIGELVVLNSSATALGTGIVQSVEAYLAWKWGIIDKLDATNLWKGAPPRFGVGSMSVGTLTWRKESGQFYSLEFDGSTDFVDLGNQFIEDELFLTATEGTIIGWLYIDDLPAGNEYFINFGDTDANTSFRIYARSNGSMRARLNWAGSLQYSVDTGTSDIPYGEWFHFAFVNDGTNGYIYINGVEVVSDTTGEFMENVTGIDNARLGCSNYNSVGNDDFWDGRMESIRVLNVALSKEQIYKDYKDTYIE